MQERISKYNDLIQIATDGRNGYNNAAENVDDAEMERQFREFAQEREGYIRELQRLVRLLNGEVREEGSASASLHRAWIDVKSAFTSGDREAIVNACITGEKSALKEYESALKDMDITSEARDVIERHYRGIKQALETIKAYKVHQ
ncbi:MAG: PA2169 family four-helix-bundle protein [Balneolaceae bacterium]